MKRPRVAAITGAVWAAVLTLGSALPLAAQVAPATHQLLLTAVGNGWIQVRVVAGRVEVASVPGLNIEMPPGGLARGAGRPGAVRDERISIKTVGGETNVSYQGTHAGQRFTMEIVGTGRIRLVQLPTDHANVTPVEFVQKPREPLRLTVGAKSSEKTYQASNLWLLFLAEPEACRVYLAPLLAMIAPRGNIHFESLTSEIEAALLRLPLPQAPDKKRWAVLVEQLGGSQYTEREAADRQLREIGQVVVPFLDQLDAGRLDAEQRFRIRRIIAALSEKEGENTPQRIALGLAPDPAVWLLLLSRSDESTRRQAAERLSILLGAPVAFDPAAAEPERARQIEQLRATLGRK